MINLLPPKAKKYLIVEYRLRLLSILMLIVAFACLMALALSFPTSILLSRQTETLLANSDLNRELGEERVRIARELSDTRTLINHLSKEIKTKPYSEIISSLDGMAGVGVSLDQFSFDNRNKLIISGIATSRAELSSFKGRLEERSDFKSVELPLSSLVKDVDLPFSITITFK